jgi:hypothetical protein
MSDLQHGAEPTMSDLQIPGDVPPHSLPAVLAHMAAGGAVAVPSYTRWIVLDSKVVKKFEKAGAWLIKEDGNGYRIRQGRGSVFILPGQLKFMRYKEAS